MYKFDVKYTFDNYLEYYKFVLIKQRIYRDLIVSFLFLFFGLFCLIDNSESTKGVVLPIICLVFAVLFPLMGLLTLPVIKKQLRSRQGDIDRTHIEITFDDEKVVYNNLTIYDENKNEEAINVNDNSNEKVEENNETIVDENNLETKPDDNELAESKNNSTTTENKENENNIKDEDRIFEFKYDNFYNIKELNGLFLFSLDKRTVIIIPKETFVGEGTIDDFKEFIINHVPNAKKVVKLKKTK